MQYHNKTASTNTPPTHLRDLHPTPHLRPHHRNRRAQTPPQLRPLYLLPDLHLPLLIKLVPEPQQRMHERHIEAPLRPIFQLGHQVLVLRPQAVLLPLLRPEAYFRRELREGRYFERFGGEGRRDEWADAVVEVGEEEDLAVGEGGEERGLVYAVE